MKNIKVDIGISQIHNISILGYNKGVKLLSVCIKNNSGQPIILKEINLFTKHFIFIKKYTERLNQNIKIDKEYHFEISPKYTEGYYPKESKFYLELITNKGIYISKAIYWSLFK